MTDTVADTGQAKADSTGTTAHAPETSTAPVGSSQTTSNGPDAAAIESFFDPTSIQGKPELEAAYKQMQRSYTAKMQDISRSKQKLETYSRFEADPINTMQQVAAQFGYQLVQKGQDAPKDWAPQTWDDVLGKAEEKVMDKMKPVFNELQSLKKQNVEQQLDKIAPDWRTYEADMVDLLKVHPTLANSPETLYRLAVPAEVLEARATKAALAKLKSSADSANVSGSTTAKQTTFEPNGPLTFQQAIEFAKKKIAGRK